MSFTSLKLHVVSPTKYIETFALNGSLWTTIFEKTSEPNNFTAAATHHGDVFEVVLKELEADENRSVDTCDAQPAVTRVSDVNNPIAEG